MIELSDAEKDFVERMGLSIQADGMSRITGRVWGLILLVGGPISSAQIAETLEISKGSVSTNTPQLETFGVIERRAVPGERQDHFALSNDPYTAVLEQQRRKFAKDAATVREAMAAVKHRIGATERLDAHLHFYEAMSEAFERASDQVSGDGHRPAKGGTR